MEQGGFQTDRKTTGDLCKALMRESNIDTYIKKHKGRFIDRSLPKLLTAFYTDRNISKAELARRSKMSVVYLHQLFGGQRKPSRDKLLCLAVGMGLDLWQTQQLLKEAAFVQLDKTLRRDAVICYGIANHISLDIINVALLEEKEKTLC